MSTHGHYVTIHTRAFFKNSSVGGGGGGGGRGGGGGGRGGIYKKGAYYTECGEMTDAWFVGNRKFGVVSHLIVGGRGSGGILPQKIFVFFYAMTAIPCIF